MKIYFVSGKLKNHAHYRILNIDDVKRSVSHNSFTCSDRIKQIFETNTSKPKTKNKYFGKLIKRNDDVNVLFSREAPKTNDRKDSNDIFGFRKHNRFRSSVSVYQQYKSQILRPKRTKSNKFFNVQKSYSTDHIPLRVMTSRRTKSGKSAESVLGGYFNPHVHRINVVEFPYDISAFCNDRYYTKCNKSFENVGIDPSSKYVCNDAECETAKVTVESVGLDPDQKYQPCDQRCFTSSGPNDGKDNNLILKVMKYILFVLAILVWSPCILMVIICWLLTYPLRPNCIRAQGAKRGMFQKRLPCGVCSGPEKGFWSSFVEWIKSAEWFNRDAYKAVVSMVKKESTEEDVECQHKLHPDPNRQYTLYHSAEKGWIMKPIRFDGKRTKILNVLCDPFFPHKRTPKKQPISENKDKKKVRITTAAGMPSDFGTGPPPHIEYRKYGKRNLGKNNAITSQPRSQPPPQPQDPCLRYCPIQTCKKHKKPKKTKAMSPLYERTRQAAEADAKARYDYTNRNAGPYAEPNAQQTTVQRQRVFGAETVSAWAAKGPCLPCVSRTAPCARPPCKACRLRILNQLQVGNYVKGKSKKAMKQKWRKEKKANLVDPKYDTRHVGHVKYKMATEKEKRKFRTRQQGNFLQRYYNYLTHKIRETEKAVWFPEFKCGQLWVQTLKEKPCFWVYKMCPTFYPACLDCRKQIGTCCHFVLFCLSTFVWFPPIFCCYLCLQAYCRFFK